MATNDTGSKNEDKSATPSPTSDKDGSDKLGSNAPNVIEKDSEDAEAGAEEEDKPDEFFRDLTILPPLQKGDDVTMKEDNTSIPGIEGAVTLPPIRAEEPVSSLRAALGEVRGYAHLTNYRFVLENHDDSSGISPAAHKRGGGGDSMQRQQTQHQQGAGGKKSKKKKGKSGGGGGGKATAATSPTGADVADDIISPYTGPNAVVSIPSAVRSLEREPQPPPSSPPTTATQDKHDVAVIEPDNEAEKQTSPEDDGEIVLDDYGDLSPLLARGLKSGSSFRIILERYDAAMVRDHVMRLRSLFDGNAPSVMTLAEEAIVPTPEDEGGENAQKNDGDTKAEEQKTEEKSDETPGDDKKIEPKQDEKEKKQEDEEQKEADLKSQLSALAEKMPSFSLDLPIAVDGTDLAGYYYLSCGEEDALRAVRGQDVTGTASKPTFSGDDHDGSKSDGSKKGKDSKSLDNEKKEKGKSAEENDEANSRAKRFKEQMESARRLNELEELTRVNCTIRYSGFHPPPPNRRILGDLAYLEVTMPGASFGEAVVHVTAIPTGFYVNRTTAIATAGGSAGAYRFNPAPAEDPCFSHELLDCLLQRSKTLRTAWATALSSSKERAEISATLSADDTPLQALHRVAVRGDMGGWRKPSLNLIQQGIDSVVLRPSWLVPIPTGGKDRESMHDCWNHNEMHEYNQARAEEDLASTFGLDVRGGSLRDWNEELQSAREMPSGELNERIDRARMLHKVLSDFCEAALEGARAIFNGHVTPMNPNEPTRSHVYLHNSIFFSRAVDAGVDTFKISQGDSAARKSASRDAQCTGALHRLDVPGLHTLATVLVDYLGTRLVCQSIVPGILHGEKTHTLLYGAVEATSPLVWNKDMHELLEENFGKTFMVATRTVPTLPLSDARMAEIEKMKTAMLIPDVKDKKEETTVQGATATICGPVEAKGILGSDQRKYVLDLTRLTPRDANWVPKAEGGTGNWEAVLEVLMSIAKTKKGAGQSLTAERVEKFIPKSLSDEEWTVAVLRQELVTALTHKKMAEWLERRKSKEKGTDNRNDEGGKEEESMKEQSSETENGIESKAAVKPNEGRNDSSSDNTKTKEEVSHEAEEQLNSLRLNVNVFLPNTKTLKGIDDDAHQQLLKDEEMAREAASYLWEKVLPKLTQEIRENIVAQIPVDGRSLTELIHRRGINCRYLGRLASLAAEEEAKDRQAERDVQNGNSTKLSRRLMPLCWLELLECEMVARASKHVLDGYLTENGGAAATQPAQTVASFLSALVSTGEESAAETEVRISKQESKGGPDEEDINALTMFDTGGDGDAVMLPIRGRSEVWEDIEREVGRRFRYVLTLYNTAQPGATNLKDDKASRALYIPLLRRVCQRNGVRIAARNYSVGGKCLCSGGNSSGGRITASYPISPVDILDILPMVKHAAAHAGEGFVPCSFGSSVGTPSLHILLRDAKASLEAAHVHLNARTLPQAMDLAQEAATLYQRVVDTPLHASVAQCLDLTAVILFQAQEPALAAANGARALAVAVQLGGFDCAEAVTAHTTLSHILVGSGGLAGGVQHLRAALYLMEIMAGPRYAEISNVYHKLGTIYHETGSGINALRFYQEATVRKTYDRMVEGMIAKGTSLVLAALGQFKPALESEKRAFGIYRLVLGEDHELTKNSANTLKQFMKLAIEQGTRMVEEDKKRKEEEAADAMASQIEADEAEEEERKKKKKNKAKKKKK